MWPGGVPAGKAGSMSDITEPTTGEAFVAARNARGSAIWYAKKGERHAAARLFDQAAELYDLAQFPLTAAACRNNAERNRRLARPTPPPNVSALVD